MKRVKSGEMHPKSHGVRRSTSWKQPCYIKHI